MIKTALPIALCCLSLGMSTSVLVYNVVEKKQNNSSTKQEEQTPTYTFTVSWYNKEQNLGLLSISNDKNENLFRSLLSENSWETILQQQYDKYSKLGNVVFINNIN